MENGLRLSETKNASDSGFRHVFRIWRNPYVIFFFNLNTNNSDIDLCEYEGKTHIIYVSGNQGNTWGGLACEAVNEGSLNEFLKTNFA